MFNLEYIRYAERFFALQVPVYYYVKTKGSLTTQGMSISKTVRMKLMVFEYYNQFYKTVFSEEEYEKSRLRVYRFLFDAAQDGSVLPLPSSRRLGNERTRVHSEALAGQGFLFDLYRERKLLDYYLEPIAIKNGLTLSETRLLLYLCQTRNGTRKELADIMSLPKSALTRQLQRLSGKGLISAIETREPGSGERQLQISFTPASEPILNGLNTACQDFKTACLSGFTAEEREQYIRWMGRVQENIRNILQ